MNLLMRYSCMAHGVQAGARGPLPQSSAVMRVPPEPTLQRSTSPQPTHHRLFQRLSCVQSTITASKSVVASLLTDRLASSLPTFRPAVATPASSQPEQENPSHFQPVMPPGPMVIVPSQPAPQPHAVLELMQARLRDGSQPSARGDGYKLGLVVEGGGMRGISTGVWRYHSSSTPRKAEVS